MVILSKWLLKINKNMWIVVEKRYIKALQNSPDF